MAFSYLTGTTAGSSDANSVTTSSINSSGATLIVVGVAINGNSPTAPTDNQGNTYTQAITVSSGIARSAIYYCVNPTTNSSHTFSYSQFNTTPTLFVNVFDGGTSTVDVTNSTNNTVSTTIQPGSVTPTSDGQLFVTVLSNFVAIADTYSINSSFTITQRREVANPNAQDGAIAYKIQTTGGAENPTWSHSNTTTNGACIATFKLNGSTSVNSNFLPFFI